MKIILIKGRSLAKGEAAEIGSSYIHIQHALCQAQGFRMQQVTAV